MVSVGNVASPSSSSRPQRTVSLASVVDPAHELVVNIRRQLGELLLAQPGQLLARIRPRPHLPCDGRIVDEYDCRGQEKNSLLLRDLLTSCQVAP